MYIEKPCLVTISIPTYNAQNHLGLCLDAVLNQTYKDFEVNIVDGNSTDKTLLIAKQKGIDNIIVCPDALLQARYEGVKAAKGEYVLLLDSDQVLKSDALERALEKIAQGFDMLILGESSYETRTLAENLFNSDKKVIHQAQDFSPLTGAILPRFFKKSLLLQAFANIPQQLLAKVGGEDHMIIYHEAYNLSEKVGFIPDAVSHIEPKSLIQVMKKAYIWGYTRKEAAVSDRYKTLLSREKARLKMVFFSKAETKDKINSLILLGLRGISGKLGFYKAKLDKCLRKSQS